MLSVLDLVVDGDVVKEAVLIDLKTMRIKVRGRDLSAPLCKLVTSIARSIPSLNYCVVGNGRHKYLVIALKNQRYIAVSLRGVVNGEEYVQKVKESLKKAGEV